MEAQPEWVVFNEFVLTTRPYIRTVSEVRPEWYVSALEAPASLDCFFFQVAGVCDELL